MTTVPKIHLLETYHNDQDDERRLLRYKSLLSYIPKNKI